jgi:tripartite-type tricarboxylate transporter receptor subunit TctC
MPVLFVIALAALGTTGTSTAQGWPSKPIHWIVPYPPGGSTDVAARPVADSVSRTLKQASIVENRAGGAGTIGINQVAKAAPDGHTVLVSPDAIVSLPHLIKQPWDPFRDFVPVVQLTSQPVVLAVHPSLGVNTVAELVALAKSKPGIAYATSGAGSQQHMAGEWFAKLAGIQLTHVPYKGGGQAISDVVGGQVPVASLGSSPLLPHYRAGKVKILAQTTRKRSAALPDVPTYEEAGFKGLVIDQWLGLFVPTGTPPEAIRQLGDAVRRALEEPTIRDRFAQVALDTIGGSQEQFAKLVRDDYAKYARLIKELNITAH